MSGCREPATISRLVFVLGELGTVYVFRQSFGLSIVLGIEPRALSSLGMFSNNELCP